MSTELSSLRAAREDAIAAVGSQRRKTVAAAENLAALLSKFLLHSAAERKLRSGIVLALELSGEDREAELVRARQRSAALLEDLASTADSLSAVLRSFHDWAAGLEQCEAELLSTADADPMLAKPDRGRPAIAMRNATDLSDPSHPSFWRRIRSLFSRRRK